MVNIFNTIIITVTIIFADAFVTFLVMVQVRLEARKKWNKNKKLYPYFHYSFFKKIFFVGLKGALNFVSVLLSFIAHIVTVLSVVLGIWNCILPNMIVSYCFRALAGISLCEFLVRLGCQLAFPLNL